MSSNLWSHGGSCREVIYNHFGQYVGESDLIFLEAELERISDPEMFEKLSNAVGTGGKTAKGKGKNQLGKNKVCKL